VCLSGGVKLAMKSSQVLLSYNDLLQADVHTCASVTKRFTTLVKMDDAVLCE